MKHLRPNWTVDSAGSVPRGDVDPKARLILQELGLDAVGPAQNVRSLPLDTYDLIVTLCSDEDICPILPLAIKERVRHVPFEDPSQLRDSGTELQPLARYREVRDQLLKFCQNIADELDKQD